MRSEVYLFVRRVNQVALIVSFILIVDLNLPLSSKKGIIEDYHRPTVDRRHNSKSSDELILHTSRGKIKVRPSDLGPGKKNTPIYLRSTQILDISKSVILLESQKEIRSNSFLFGYFALLPWLIMLLSTIALVTKSRMKQLNVGSVNVPLLALLIYLISENFLR